MKNLAIIFCCLFAYNTYANDECMALKANKKSAEGEYVFKQHAFDNKQDLVIVDPQAEVRRVTFGRGAVTPICYFQPLAFTQGGKGEKYWGWHLFWSEPQGLFYARVDGEAWVSSLPKCFTKLVPINPQFKLDGENIVITWQQVENGVTANMQALSSDEGRSWELNLAPP